MKLPARVADTTCFKAPRQWAKEWFQPVEVRRPADAPKEMVVSWYLRPFGTWYFLLFTMSMIFGAIVTFTSTDYEADRDYIFKFFGQFNPCIFYDHYPSNVVSLIFTFGWVLSAFAFGLTIWAFSVLEGDFLRGAVVSLLSLIILFVLANFNNVFAANLYEAGYKEADEDLDNDDRVRIAWHALPYVMLQYVNIGVLYVTITTLQRARGRLFWYEYAFAAFTIFAMVVAGTSSANKTSPGSSGLRTGLVWVDELFKVQSWSWLTSLVQRMLPASGMGVSARISLAQESQGRHGSLSVEGAVAFGFRILAIGLLVAFYFTDPKLDDDSVAIPLTSAFREFPTRLIFIPVWMLNSVAAMWASVLAVVRISLQGYPRWLVILTGAAGAFYSFSTVLCSLIVIPQIESTAPFFFLYFTSLVLWLIVLYLEPKQYLESDRPSKMWRAAVFILLLVIFFVLAVSLPNDIARAVFASLLVVLLCLFPVILGVDKQGELSWTLSQLRGNLSDPAGDVSMSALEAEVDDNEMMTQDENDNSSFLSQFSAQAPALPSETETEGEFSEGSSEEMV